ncbi:uncharacterized protein GGS22DRAFT_199702 [Annulohypoxylon maeteangense]|uniref:uncharacterized protein n=1 Tax=Annulohypoxylon maeteangense TaxID=1927788 RepID=UPI0020083E81|nr:uncharacterized protein GGS22DRAFT_199702 [Annulohypoxylon maeteangense]KAI0886418.1 hypothetical protein GGS22DRAFT_199702 [Annulohypoxylon maeteangense]
MSSESKDGVLAVCGSMLSLSSIAVGLRFHARNKTHMPIMTDDVLTVASLISFAGAAIISIIMVQYHIIGYALSPAIAGELSAKLQIAWDVLGTTSLACSKLSALFFYRRIFYVGGNRCWFNITVIITIIMVIIWLVVFQFLTGFQCGTHFSATWDGTYEKYCTLSFPYLYGFAVSDFLLDIWILSLPIPRILRLNATLSKKLAVLGVFFLTFIGLFASGARMTQYIQAERGGPDYFINHDEERIITIIFFYTMLETGVSLIAVNLPSLWFLVASISPDKIMRSISNKLSFSSLPSDTTRTPVA